MISITIDPVYIEVGVPALAIGLAIGALLVGLIGWQRRKKLLETIRLAHGDLKNQETLQDEREAAFELANAKLSAAFSNLANQSLQSNSENFLRLAEQNLGTQQEKAKRELGEREQAVEALVKPIRDALEASQKQRASLSRCKSISNRSRKRLRILSMRCDDRKFAAAGEKLRFEDWSSWPAWWSTVTSWNRFIPQATRSLFART